MDYKFSTVKVFTACTEDGYSELLLMWNSLEKINEMEDLHTPAIDQLVNI